MVSCTDLDQLSLPQCLLLESRVAKSSVELLFAHLLQK